LSNGWSHNARIRRNYELSMGGQCGSGSEQIFEDLAIEYPAKRLVISNKARSHKCQTNFLYSLIVLSHLDKYRASMLSREI
jgi:hypothetical protein